MKDYYIWRSYIIVGGRISGCRVAEHDIHDLEHWHILAALGK